MSVENPGAIRIVGIKVLRQANMADTVWLFPEGMMAPVWPFDEPLTAQFSSAQTKTAEFLEKHFSGVPVEWINATRG